MSEPGAVALPDTALVTLCFRANEARRSDWIIEDPVAIELAETVDYDFTKLRQSKRQDLALRALAFDNEIRRYLSGHPEATVVALGEGMQTSFWRLDAADVGDKFRWLTVDLPQNVALRERLLPTSPRISMCAQSALDFSWMDRVDSQKGVFITAEGILPYFQPEQALSLIGECARRFPGGEMMFDLPTKLQTLLSRQRSRTKLPTVLAAHPVQPFGARSRRSRKNPRSPGGTQRADPRGRGSLFNLLWKTQELPDLWAASSVGRNQMADNRCR